MKRLVEGGRERAIELGRERKSGGIPVGILYAKSCSRADVNGIKTRQKRCNIVASEYNQEYRKKEMQIE